MNLLVQLFSWIIHKIIPIFAIAKSGCKKKISEGMGGGG